MSRSISRLSISRLLSTAAVGLVLAGLLGCRSVPATRYYLLAPPSTETLADGTALGTAAGEMSPAEGLRMGVETFAVDPPYDQSRLIYRVGESSGEVGFYEHHRWAAEPGRLVATALAGGLRGLEPLADVEPSTALGSYDVILTGRVVRLEEIDLPGRHLARIQLDLKLYELEGDTLVWSRLLTAETGGTASDASDIMRQMQAAFEDLLEQLRKELGPPLERVASSG